MPKGFPVRYQFMDDALAAHAAVGMCVDYQNYPMFFDCGNDVGLAVAGLNFPGYAAYADTPAEGKTNVCAYEFPLWVAATFASVDEAEAALANVAIVGASAGEGLGVSYLHWIIGDATRSIVVESRADGMHVMDDPVDVLTNQPPSSGTSRTCAATSPPPATSRPTPSGAVPSCPLRRRRRHARYPGRLLLALALCEGRLPQRQLSRQVGREGQRHPHVPHARGRCHGGGRGPHGQRRLRAHALHQLLQRPKPVAITGPPTTTRPSATSASPTPLAPCRPSGDPEPRA